MVPILVILFGSNLTLVITTTVCCWVMLGVNVYTIVTISMIRYLVIYVGHYK
ncbi:hypothetical protein MKX01_032304 [Papaver californicum]|nr:hypothetical protein MKX01_032304 [Papaver californicum]